MALGNLGQVRPLLPPAERRGRVPWSLAPLEIERVVKGRKAKRITLMARFPLRSGLRLRGIRDLEQANKFLRSEYLLEFNRKFTVAETHKGSAFVRSRRKDFDWIFSVQHERTANHDNTILLENRVFQLEKTRWRNTLAGQTVMLHEHLDGRVSIRYGPHVSDCPHPLDVAYRYGR